MNSTKLPLPPMERPAVADWVAERLPGLFEGPAVASERFRGGQSAADAALGGFEVGGYARRRSEVWPPARRGASGLSPWIRHGLLPLPRVWRQVADGPPRDVARFRDELLWQEYARHLYARLGRRLARSLRPPPRPPVTPGGADPWPREMRCMELCLDELEGDGWLVNQTRMWLASQWSVRGGADWREGEDRFFRHLLDGSRAANRLGWQWTVGAATGRPYGFSRWQVEKRAPQLCRECGLRDRCPIETWPDPGQRESAPPPPELRRRAGAEAEAGPERPRASGEAEAVWITAESLGDADPALAAHPDRPAVFVFDAPLLERLQLSGKRLVFLAECLADLASRRSVEVWRGDPVEVLAGRQVAVTHAPVPGFERRSRRVGPVVVHPWPWLRRPRGGPLQSFSAWRRSYERR